MLRILSDLLTKPGHVALLAPIAPIAVAWGLMNRARAAAEVQMWKEGIDKIARLTWDWMKVDHLRVHSPQRWSIQCDDMMKEFVSAETPAAALANKKKAEEMTIFVKGRVVDSYDHVDALRERAEAIIELQEALTAVVDAIDKGTESDREKVKRHLDAAREAAALAVGGEAKEKSDRQFALGEIFKELGILEEIT